MMTAANFQDENNGARDFAPTPSTPKELKDITLGTDDDLCSALPVLDEFVMSVNEILRMPKEK